MIAMSWDAESALDGEEASIYYPCKEAVVVEKDTIIVLVAVLVFGSVSTAFTYTPSNLLKLSFSL